MRSSADVVVVGAGLAGLTAARDLTAAGAETLVLEGSDAVGGRARTDRVDGLRLDRGFQIFLPTYPQAPRVWDLAALRLRPFEAGLVVADARGRRVIGDPRRLPSATFASLTLPIGSVREKAALVRWALECGYLPAAALKRRGDVPLGDGLGRRGLAGALTENVLRTFLAGVLGEEQLRTSFRYTELVVRCFVRGNAAIPAEGIQVLAEELARTLPPGTVHCNVAVRSVTGSAVETDAGSIRARCVVVAADPVSAAGLTGIPRPSMRALTTYYHLADEPPSRRALLHVDAARRGPIVNTVVITNAAPLYGPGRHLVASTVLGSDDGLEPEVRRHAAAIYGVPTRGWEHVRTYAIPQALPDLPAGTPLRKRVDLGDGLFVAGDHRDTPSIQGALVSGRRAAAATLRQLGVRA